ncbi:MAG: bifunctional GNAT family N-acetyltransferase/hotdog fold thioesterase [Gammaproteobacteria bacterium]|nr:bifunctional GNAT family N-acetyltransferase/hotdog fold thioesterase [Gammaproteobacteria bacterium]MBU1556818.1 bifunctional GNAT family N-acetyltransferase/hotdog fold thioesterase [Gammaproteobacteria bacterium]MBU2072097.1 bifunctional GNAT family N-acetyltransferase/hotdog fold thioesterase [Gammaproteobacteria bacterium]MBU2183518.1 bifunctional GNAT family N-acetyltransferase/hotdog fold thioesterase [Gammaproteobacteria bacterium]MBU2203428.1 bifunctional GNAT family N-acetyltransfe
MRHWQIRSPANDAEWQQYFQLRYQVLRAPWQQAPGSERDELEAQAYHLMLLSPQGELAAVGRLHRLDDNTAQVRYMAVAEAFRGQGAGAHVLDALEQQAVDWGCQRLKLNARDNAKGFYQRAGYQQQAAAAPMFGIPHWLMQKSLRLESTEQQFQQWCNELNTTWQQTIPLTAYMQLDIREFDGASLLCSAPLAPNINLHRTMFAGSIYALATLTGWGMLYLQLKQLGLTGDQVLADASIKYRRPVEQLPSARCSLRHCIGDLSALMQGKKVVQQIKVEIYSGDTLAAEFAGRYAVLPVKAKQ